jgi:predicted lipoprotein
MALVSVRGLDTIGYLLSASTESSCPSQVPPISDGSWDTLGEDAIFQQRIEYALVLAEDVQARLLVAQDQWADGFPHDLYASQSAALNDVFNAMLYVEEMVKDRKLAHPMGLQECTIDCHLDIESGDSVEYLIANLESFERLFTLGDETGGMVAVMEELGEQDIALSIASQTRLSIDTLSAIDAPLSNVIQDSPEQIETAIELLSEVTTPLKWDVAAVLRLEIPDSAAGDND